MFQGPASRPERQVEDVPRGCEIVAFAPEEMHEAGELVGRARSSDVVDAHVVLTAALHGSSVITSEENDPERQSSCLQEPIVIHQVRTRRQRRQP